MKVAWWTWSDEDIKRAAPLLLDENIEAFLIHARRMKAPGR